MKGIELDSGSSEFMGILTKKKENADASSFKEQLNIRGNEEALKKVEQVKVIEDDSVIGKHVFGDLYNVDKNAITDENYLNTIMRECISMANVKLTEIKTVAMGGRNGGITVIALMDAGHAVLHAWNNDNYATLDIFTFGGRSEPGRAFDYVVSKLRPKRHKVFSVDRSQIRTT